MRWRVWVAMALLAAILVGGIITLRLTDRLCSHLAASLDAAYSDGYGFEEAYAFWRKYTSFFSALVNHDRVDEISQGFARAQAFLAAGTADEYRAEVESLLLQLSLIMEYDHPTVRSLL
ncbi:MAG: DUF4363 family protein [Clostridiaceae bacterium]|nr:DUF4363 family protein [Clostridiaceae bacterium]